MQTSLAFRRWGTWLFPAAMLTAAFFAPLFVAPVRAQESALGANDLVVKITSKLANIELTEKATRILETKAKIKTVSDFDPAVLGVTEVTGVANQIRLTGIAPGVTTVVLVDEDGESFNVEVLVTGDVKHLEAIIRQNFSDSSVRATKVGGAVLLSGWVNQPSQLTKIVNVAEQFFPNVINNLQVSGVQQVMLHVKIMEVQRDRIRNLGFNFLNLRDGSYIASQVGNITPLTALTAPFGGPPAATMNQTASTVAFGLLSQDNVFQGFVEALKQEALLKILAEPDLIAVNGRPANFLSGGEFPILIPQGLGTISVQFKSFGVSLEFVPNVMGNGRLRMDVRPEVSEKDVTNTVTVGTTTVPGLTTRRVQTQVEMSFGQTLVIAGLISNRITSRTQKIPFLGELPWIGAAFRRVNHDEAETELLVLVTPEPASPMDEPFYGGPGQNTVSPTDRELFFNGYIEVPRFAPDPECPTCPPGMVQPAGYVAPNDMIGPTNGPSNAPIPPAPENPLPPPLPMSSAGPNSGSRSPSRDLIAPPIGDESMPPPIDELQTTQGTLRNAGYVNPAFGNRVAPSDQTNRRPGPVTPRSGAVAPQPNRAQSKPGPIAPGAAPSNANASGPRTNTRPGMIAP